MTKLVDSDIHLRVEVIRIAENVFLRITSNWSAHRGSTSASVSPEVLIKMTVLRKTGHRLTWISPHHCLAEAALLHDVRNVGGHVLHHAVKDDGGSVESFIRSNSVSDNGQSVVCRAVSFVIVGVW